MEKLSNQQKMKVFITWILISHTMICNGLNRTLITADLNVYKNCGYIYFWV